METIWYRTPKARDMIIDTLRSTAMDMIAED